ncbi:hypothetical protein D3C87_1333850 [compost metagenome]
MDESGFQLQLLAQRARIDDADFAALAVVVVETLAQNIGTSLAVDVVPVVDAVAGRQVDLAAHEGAGIVAADRVPAAVAVIVILLVAQDGAVGVDADDRPSAVGVAGRCAVAQGHAPGAVAFAGGELIGAAVQVLAAFEQTGVGRQDVFAAGGGLQDDVGDDRIALHVDAGGAAADQFDALDLSGNSAAQDVGASVVLGRRARAVDQDVADRAFKAAGAVAVVDREARHAVDHVQRRIGAGVGEEVGGEDQDALVLGLGGLGRARRVGESRRGDAERQHGCGGQQDGLGHGVVPLRRSWMLV